MLVLDLRPGRLEPLLVLVLLGHVEDLRDEVERLAVRSAHHSHREIAPDDVPVRVQIALAHAVAVDLSGHSPVEHHQVAVEVLGMGDLLEAHAGTVARR